MSIRWPWRRARAPESLKGKPPIRLPQTIWIGDVKKAGDWGASLYQKNHPQGIQKPLR
jgi:hypothetical protein